MKKINVLFLAALLLFTSSLSACFGTFGLTRKVYTFNENMGGKFVQTLMMYVLFIIPVYEIAGFLDFVVFNLIEFWTGSNPMAMKVGESETQMAKIDGKMYEITATRNQFSIRQTEGPDAGKEALLKYQQEEKQWYLVEGEKSVAIGKINFRKLN
jgi:hypothetical protein